MELTVLEGLIETLPWPLVLNMNLHSLSFKKAIQDSMHYLGPSDLLNSASSNKLYNHIGFQPMFFFFL